MALRDGYYAGAGSGASGQVLFGTEMTPLRVDDGFLSVVTAAAVANQIYKNQGWYSAGSTFETWVTSGDPSTTAPSGHTLTDYQHTLLQN